MKNMALTLSDGTRSHGKSFGYDTPMAGKVAFNTAMMDYLESLTDPSYESQLLTLTFSLVNNYGVPPFAMEKSSIPSFMESRWIHASALIVSDCNDYHNHWNAVENLSERLEREKMAGIANIDTRKLIRMLCENGIMMGKILFNENPELVPEADYTGMDFVDRVGYRGIIRYSEGTGKEIMLVDYGVEADVARSLLNRDVEVVRAPWNYDYTGMEFDGLLLTSGPNDPDMCEETVNIIHKRVSESRKPIRDICTGNQLLAEAGGATIYKLRYGHRLHNQPVR